MKLNMQHDALVKGDPPPIPESGTAEMRSIIRAFNQMSSDIRSLDNDRTLVMAG